MAQKEESLEPATPHPAEFELGSPASRAAARALLEGRRSDAEANKVIVTIVQIGAPPGSPLPPPLRIVHSDGSVTEIRHATR